MGDAVLMQVRLANSLEPNWTLRRRESNQRKRFAAVQLLEIFQLHTKRVNYRTYPILQLSHPTEPGERARTVSLSSAYCLGVSRFKGAAFVILWQKMGKCIMDGEPLHVWRTLVHSLLYLDCSKISW